MLRLKFPGVEPFKTFFIFKLGGVVHRNGRLDNPGANYGADYNPGANYGADHDHGANYGADYNPGANHGAESRTNWRENEDAGDGVDDRRVESVYPQEGSRDQAHNQLGQVDYSGIKVSNKRFLIFS